MAKKRTSKTVTANKAATKTAIAVATPMASKSVAINKPKMAVGKNAIAPVATTTSTKKAPPVVAKTAVKITPKTNGKTTPKIATPAAPKMMSAKKTTTTKKTVKK